MRNPYAPGSREYRAWSMGYCAGRSDKAEGPAEWRVVGIAPEYEISSTGALRRFKSRDGRPPRAIQGQIDKGGYRRYFLRTVDGGKVLPAHRLVCEAFIGERPSAAHFVAHGDGDRLNNRIDNLRWATRQENEADKELHGTRAIGQAHGHAKLSESDALAILQSTSDAREVAAQFNIHPSTVRDIRKGRRWKHLTRSKVTAEVHPDPMRRVA